MIVSLTSAPSIDSMTVMCHELGWRRAAPRPAPGRLRCLKPSMCYLLTSRQLRRSLLSTFAEHLISFVSSGCMGVFCFSFALLRDTHHECAAGGSVSPCLEYRSVLGTVVRDEIRRCARVHTEAPGAQPGEPGAASHPSHLAISACRTCAWLCSVAHITGRHTLVPFIFIFAPLPATLYDSASP